MELPSSHEGQPLFDIARVDERQSAEITLREHKASLLIMIPENFSAVLQDFTGSGGSGTETSKLSSSAISSVGA